MRVIETLSNGPGPTFFGTVYGAMGQKLEQVTGSSRHALIRKAKLIPWASRLELNRRIGYATYYQRPRWQGGDNFAGWKLYTRYRVEEITL